jgi:hypothetical protein
VFEGKSLEDADAFKAEVNPLKPETPKVPPEWKEVPIQDLFSKGWKPYRKTVEGKTYIVLRKGEYMKSLGPYSEDRWELLLSMYPYKLTYRGEGFSQAAASQSLPQTQGKEAKGNILSVGIDKPPSLPRQVKLSLKTLMYYEWAKSKGFSGGLEDFLNQVCEAFFLEHGLEPVIVVRPQGDVVE